MAEVRQVSPEEAQALLSEGYRYVDVRSEREFAEGHPAGAFNELGQPKNIHDIPPELRMAIKGMKQTKFGMEFTFYDRSTIMLALLGYFERDNKKRAEETEEKTIIEYYQDEEYD